MAREYLTAFEMKPEDSRFVALEFKAESAGACQGLMGAARKRAKKESNEPPCCVDHLWSTVGEETKINKSDSFFLQNLLKVSRSQ